MNIKVIWIDERIHISLVKGYMMEDINEWNKLILDILTIWKDQLVTFITLSPKPYSVGNELSNGQKVNWGKENYLINSNIVLTREIIQLILESEEFDRGLLTIVLSSEIRDVLETIDSMNLIGSVEFDKIKVGVVALEDDGETITIANISKEGIEVIDRLIHKYNPLCG